MHVPNIQATPVGCHLVAKAFWNWNLPTNMNIVQCMYIHIYIYVYIYWYLIYYISIHVYTYKPKVCRDTSDSMSSNLTPHWFDSLRLGLETNSMIAIQSYNTYPRCTPLRRAYHRLATNVSMSTPTLPLRNSSHPKHDARRLPEWKRGGLNKRGYEIPESMRSK